MFKGLSNGAFSNIAFSPATMAGMDHASLQRLYQVAEKQSPPVKGKKGLCVWLKVSEQLVNNWAKRGVSQRAAVEVEKRTGYSAAWLITGEGQELLANRKPEPTGKRFDAPTEAEMKVLNDLRILLDEDRDALVAQIAERAAKARAFLRKHGLDQDPIAAKKKKTAVPSTN